MDVSPRWSVERVLARFVSACEPEPEPTPSIDQFERVLTLLSELDWDAIWEAATDQERRTLLDEFVGQVNVFSDHLEVEVRGAPKLNVALHEVGLQRAVETAGVGGGTSTRVFRVPTRSNPKSPTLSGFQEATGRRQTVMLTPLVASHRRPRRS